MKSLAEYFNISLLLISETFVRSEVRTSGGQHREHQELEVSPELFFVLERSGLVNVICVENALLICPGRVTVV
jgi:hypothetical protein